METPKYLPGEKVGHLEIIGDTGRRTAKGEIIYECRCECGTIKLYKASALNETKSCGCKSNSFRGYVDGTQISQIRPDKPTPKNNTSGCTGVTRRKDCWVAFIKFKQTRIYLGRFSTYEEAVVARKTAEKLLFYPIWNKYNNIMT